MAIHKQLTAHFVEHHKTPGTYADGDRLYLQIQTSKRGGVTKSWLWRYLSPTRHKERQAGPHPRWRHELEDNELKVDAGAPTGRRLVAWYKKTYPPWTCWVHRGDRGCLPAGSNPKSFRIWIAHRHG